MSVLRFVAVLARAALAVMASVPQMIWESGKWVLRSVFPQPPMAAAETAHLVQEALATPAAAPAKATEPVVDPALDWGRIVRDYAASHLSGSLDEASLAGLDEAAEAWVRGLSTLDLARVAKLAPRTIGEHILGEQRIKGLPRCLSLREYEERLVEALIPGTREHSRLQAQADELAEGVELLREAGKLQDYRGV